MLFECFIHFYGEEKIKFIARGNVRILNTKHANEESFFRRFFHILVFLTFCLRLPTPRSIFRIRVNFTKE